MMIGTATGLLTVCITDQPAENVIAQAAEHYHVVRATTMNGLETALDRAESSHLLVEGLLDALYDPRVVTRDAARALGRVKHRLETLADSGVEVVVLCEVRRNDLGTRAHFLNSLCAAADRVVSDLLAA